MLATMAGLAALAAAPVQAQNARPQGAKPQSVGVHRDGRADAPLTLTEYVSYTCPHCVHFHDEANDTLNLVYVARGRIIRETRNVIRDPADLAAALSTNCGDANRFAGNHNLMFRSQSEWLARLQKATAAQRARWSSGTLGSRMQAIARDAGFYELMAKRGYRAAELDRCLADEATARTLSEKSAGYLASGLNTTPSFAIDGVVLAGTHQWSMLQPQLDARLKP